ncbi:hypothetical protein [Sediminicola arcticus]|jgi:hypothetical protein|uniref:Uncharacterized protein n=1 Tax=Sediminicola arcticus TaxID=1574308 RepID=A0ABV2ST23_9FLAO
MIAEEQFESEIVMQAFMPLSIDKIGSQYVSDSKYPMAMAERLILIMDFFPI